MTARTSEHQWGKNNQIHWLLQLETHMEKSFKVLFLKHYFSGFKKTFESVGFFAASTDV